MGILSPVVTDGKTASAYSAVVIAATLWGFIGLVSRNLDEEGFTPMEVTFLRTAICVVVLFAVMLIFDRKSLRIRPRDLWMFVLCGVFKLLIDLLLFEAQMRIHLALATVLQLTSPYFVLLFSVFMFSEKVTAQKVAAIIIAFTGCIFVTGLIRAELSFDALGCIFALVSGISYAAYTVGSKFFLDKGYSENTTMFYIFLFGTILCTPFLDMGGMTSKIDGFEPVANLLMVGIMQTLVPYYLIAYALKHANAVKVNLLGLLEVVAAALVGFFFYSETLEPLNLIGMILIPASIVLMNIELKRRNADGDPS